MRELTVRQARPEDAETVVAFQVRLARELDLRQQRVGVPAPRPRGGGFKAMYQTLREQVARSEELAGLRLFVDKANELGIKAYEALGMTREHYHLYEWLK